MKEQNLDMLNEPDYCEGEQYYDEPLTLKKVERPVAKAVKKQSASASKWFVQILPKPRR